MPINQNQPFNMLCNQTILNSKIFWLYNGPLKTLYFILHLLKRQSQEHVISRGDCPNSQVSVMKPSHINSSPHSAAYFRQWIGWALVQIRACRLFGAQALSKPMLSYCQLGPRNKFPWNSYQNKKKYSRKCIWKCRLRIGGQFVQGWIS